MWVICFHILCMHFTVWKVHLDFLSGSHTLSKVCYCWSGRSVECCVAKRRAERYSTGDCISTQSLCCTRRGLFPLAFIHSLMSHSVQIHVWMFWKTASPYGNLSFISMPNWHLISKNLNYGSAVTPLHANSCAWVTCTWEKGLKNRWQKWSWQCGLVYSHACEHARTSWKFFVSH